MSDLGTHELPVLWQIRNSIFCEKARWALDYKGVPHRRKDLMPGMHSVVLRLRGRGTTVPVLDLGRRSVRGSSAINAALEALYPNRALYPSDADGRKRALALEARFDPIGHEVRRVVVDPILRERSLLTRILLASRSAPERALARALHPLSASMMRRRYGIDRTRVERAHERILQSFDEIEAVLGKSGRYLVGDCFSVADLTAAALLAPLVQPQQYPDAAWKKRSFPAELCELRDYLADRPGGTWVLDIYRRHRGCSTEIIS
jgi:glutathione S-transferase